MQHSGAVPEQRAAHMRPWLLLLLLTVPSAGVARTDRAFYEAFIQGGIAEIDAANLALQKSSNAMVKEFAAMMIKDHTSANERVKALAASQRTTLPSSASAADRAVQAKLTSLSPRIFDQFYIRSQIYAHEQLLDLVSTEVTSGKDAKAKAFAGDILPTVQSHLKLIRVLAASEGV
jgi:putative membrane protein